MRGVLLVALPDAVALAGCAIAVLTDQSRRVIPNWLTATVGVLGLVLAATLGGTSALLASLGGAALALVVFGVPAAFDMIGMGDVKLAAAIGALLRWPLALPFVLYLAIAGGVVAIVYANRTGVSITRNVRRNVPLHRMPYALAIAIGCAWAIASRHVEALRLLRL